MDRNHTKGGEVQEMVRSNADLSFFQCSQTVGSQASAVEDVLYGSIDVSARRLEGTDVLRGVNESHITQLLGVIEDVIHELRG